MLVVDDDPLLADLTGEWVREKWDCETVNDGTSALEVVGDGFDVVLLDRQMPGLRGEEVLAAIRERELPIQVLMVSGVEPGFDVVELPFDDYLRKPIDRPTLQEKVEALLLRRTYHPDIREFFASVAKLELLEASMPSAELVGDDRYLGLKARADELRQASDATLGEATELVAGLHDAKADD